MAEMRARGGSTADLKPDEKRPGSVGRPQTAGSRPQTAGSTKSSKWEEEPFSAAGLAWKRLREAPVRSARIF